MPSKKTLLLGINWLLTPRGSLQNKKTHLWFEDERNELKVVKVYQRLSRIDLSQ